MTWGDVEAPITAMGSAAAGTLAFRVGGELRVAVVVKASFILAPDAAMLRTDPDPIVRADKLRDKSPASSVVAAGDLVPYRPRADVLLTGHARAPRDAPTPAMGVRLMVARGQEVVLDKRLAVRGTPDPASRAREPLPFAAMLLAWELAAGSPDNPVGIRESATAWPHIVDPRSRDKPAGFGPISARWPSRQRLLKLDERAFGAPVPELPRDFDWAYFNAAPEDQRIDFLRGDEWVGFEGMNSQLPRVQSCLPGVRAQVKVYGPTPELLTGRPLPVEADTLLIDSDRLRCSVVWRGSFPVPGGRESDLAALHVFAGVAAAAEALAFPAAYSGRPPGARTSSAARTPPGSSPGRAPVPPNADETATTDAPPQQAPRPATPFADAPQAPRKKNTRKDDPQTETVLFEIAAPSSASPMPFAPSSAPARPANQSLPAATPFERARLAPPPVPVAAGATVDVASLLQASLPGSAGAGAADLGESTQLPEQSALRAPALPFAPTHSAATPFERARVAPPAAPVAAGATVDVASLLQASLPGSAGAGTADLGEGTLLPEPSALRASTLPFAPAGSSPSPMARSTPGPRPRAPEAGGTMDVSELMASAGLPFSSGPPAPSQAAPPPRPSAPPPATRPSAPPPPSRPADMNATMDVSALVAMLPGNALPFQNKPSPAPLPPARPAPPPPPPSSAGSTMDIGAVLAAQPLPFQGAPPAAPPVWPVPPVPAAPSGPLFPEVPRPSVAAIPATPEGAPLQAPARLDLPLAAPAAPSPEGEAPKKLGASFLAAMARAGRGAGAPGASIPG